MRGELRCKTQADLFDGNTENANAESCEEKAENESVYSADLAELFELSVEAYSAALHARMSCLPIAKEISRYIEKVKNSGSIHAVGGVPSTSPQSEVDRINADKAAFDRGDPDVLTVLRAAGKVRHEIHRLLGLLRFSPDSNGFYTARCAPDHLILPALAEHFTLRFGETPWIIIDEKREICLLREKGAEAVLVSLSSQNQKTRPTENCTADFWEDLWRLYHRSINNESRKNPGLQLQFMPRRYQKYLPEMKN